MDDHIEQAAITFHAALMAREKWVDLALCAEIGGDAWFPLKGESPLEAKAVCARCEVRDECLEYALDHEDAFGVWGGLTGTERRRLKISIEGAAA